MKFTKIVAVLAIAALATVDVASAASFGRSGGSSFSRSTPSRSYSAPSRSYSAPAPAPRPTPTYSAPAPTRQSSGIGGTAGSMGVRKSEVTAPVAQRVETQRAATTPSYSSPSRAPAPTTSPSSYTSPAPVYAAPAAAPSGGGFWAPFAGAMGGTLLGNALFGNNHGSGGGTTVINNGTPGGGGAAAPVAAAGAGAVPGVADAGGWAAGTPAMAAAPAKSYGIGSFIWDVLSIAFLIAVLVGLAFLAYKAFKMIRNYVNRERGVAATQPFAPTAKFWEIQNAFAAGDVATLKTLLGPDLVDEATRGLEPSEINLSRISHEIALQNPREFSVHYKFFDGNENTTVDQVWHYELHDGTWKLNGIETL